MSKINRKKPVVRQFLNPLDFKGSHTLDQAPWGSRVLRPLSRFQGNMTVVRGLESRAYDRKLVDLILEYSRNPKQVKSELIYLKYLKDEDGRPFSRNLYEYRHFQAPFQRFQSRDSANLFWFESYQSAIKLVQKYLLRQRDTYYGHLYPNEYDHDMVRENLPKTDTHSGFMYFQTGHKRKGDNVAKLPETLRELIALDDFAFNKCKVPILPSYRTQGSGEYDEQGHRTYTCKHKTRLVSMIDLRQIALELIFSKPFQDYFKTFNCSAVGKNDTDISNIISNMQSKFNFYTSIDYSSFDQTIPAWLIRDAFEIIRKCFIKDLSGLYTTAFNKVVDDFITKSFVTDFGFIPSEKGIPSGSMFTQLIGCIANMIMIHTYMLLRHGVGKYDMIVMGDDNLIYSEEPIDMTSLSISLKRWFGVEIHPNKCNNGENPESPLFLSRFWTPNGPTRHWKLVLSRMAYPERVRIYDDFIGPEHVLYCYGLMYRSVNEFIYFEELIRDFKLTKDVVNQVDGKYIPGILMFLRDYT